MAKGQRNANRRHTTASAQTMVAKDHTTATSAKPNPNKAKAPKPRLSSSSAPPAVARQMAEHAVVEAGPEAQEVTAATPLPAHASASSAPAPQADHLQSSMSGSGHTGITASHSWRPGMNASHSHVTERTAAGDKKAYKPRGDLQAAEGPQEVDMDSSVSSLSSVGCSAPPSPTPPPAPVPPALLYAHPAQYVPLQPQHAHYYYGQAHYYHDAHHDASTTFAQPHMATGHSFGQQAHYAPQQLQHTYYDQSQWQHPHDAFHAGPHMHTPHSLPKQHAHFHGHTQHYDYAPQPQQHTAAFPPQAHVYGAPQHSVLQHDSHMHTYGTVPQQQQQQQQQYRHPPSVPAYHDFSHGYHNDMPSHHTHGSQPVPHTVTEHNQTYYHDQAQCQAYRQQTHEAGPSFATQQAQHHGLHQRDWHYPGELDPACNYIHTPYASFRKADVQAGLATLPVPLGPPPSQAMGAHKGRGNSKSRAGKGSRGRKPVAAY